MINLQISLAAARVNARLTQKQVAQKMHISKQTLVNWEKGVTYPKPAYFEMLCRIYGLERENIFLPPT